MNAEHAELLQRLKHFNLDAADSAFPFSLRLAKENQWSPAYTTRVIEEYKRFAFLAVAAGHPVSPSEDVDQAWHLHLIYSQSYWREFCPEVLKQPFHHQPTKGGAGEHAKFQDWYAQTLASYNRFFGENPPRDIWPSPEARETMRQHFVRVDREQYWLIRKPQWLRWKKQQPKDGKKCIDAKSEGLPPIGDSSTGCGGGGRGECGGCGGD